MLWRMRGRGGGARLRRQFRRVESLLGCLAAFLVRFGMVGVGDVSRRKRCGGVVGAARAAAHLLLLDRSGGFFGGSGGGKQCGSSVVGLC